MPDALSSSPTPPAPVPAPDASHPDRDSKASYDSASPSFPASTTSSSRLLYERSTPSFPPISYRFTAAKSSPSLSAASDSPYLGPSRPLSLGDQYTLSPDPQKWGSELLPEYKEEDDDLHKPDPPERVEERQGPFLTSRGVVNVGSLVVLITGILTLL